jgi:hypothetical protein
MTISIYPTANFTINTFGNSNIALGAGLARARVVGLEITNTLATTAHWLVITNTATSPTAGAATVAAFWNPGTAGFQAFYDKEQLTLKSTNGFTVIRSSTPTTFTALAATLTQPSLVIITYNFK